MKKLDYSFKALGTVCNISVISKENNLNNIVNSVYSIILNFENDFSRFKGNSLLSLLNIKKKLEVNSDFLDLVHKSKEMYFFTNCYFNPLVNIKNIGYSGNFEDGKFEIIRENQDLNFKEIKNYGSLLEIGKDMNLDFGSIAKGYLSQKVSNFLTSKGYYNNLVDIGGDIYVSGLNLDNKKWNISIFNPFEIKVNQETQNFLEEKDLEVELSNSSISTSGTYIRKWTIEEKEYHHIKNPFSEYIEKEIVSASIISSDGYFTDAVATAVIAMGLEKALTFCKKNSIKYIFILNNSKIIKNI